jgi:Flp pilus assembly protein TadG
MRLHCPTLVSSRVRFEAPWERRAGRTRCRRRGRLLACTAAVMIACFALLVFAIDWGYVGERKARLQRAADAAALAGAYDLPASTARASFAAIHYAVLNEPECGQLLRSEDVVCGIWNHATGDFTPTTSGANAIQVTVRPGDAERNRVSRYFARMLGFDESLSVSAIAYAKRRPRLHYLLDEDMIDVAAPAIQRLAASLGVSPEQLITDNNGDGFLDLPPNQVLELGAGRHGDEAIFDVAGYRGAFPFGNGAYSTKDFLAAGTRLQQPSDARPLEYATWSSGAPETWMAGRKVLGLVPGVNPVSRSAAVYAMVNPDIVHVSPVFAGDIVMAERDPSRFGSPIANLQGKRRGLLAYRVLGARPNPAGRYSLPLLTIQVVDPASIDIGNVAIANPDYETAAGRLVR